MAHGSGRHESERSAFSFDARYGRLIRKAGIGTIPFALFYYQADLDLAPQEVWLIGYVLSHRWTSALPFPAVREMARRSGVSTKTLEKYKKELERKGYLDVVRRTRADGGNTSIGWDFSPLFEEIDRLITRDIEEWVRRNPQFLEEDEAEEVLTADVPRTRTPASAPTAAPTPSRSSAGRRRTAAHNIDNVAAGVPVVEEGTWAVVRGFPRGGEGGSHGDGDPLSGGPFSRGRTRFEEESEVSESREREPRANHESREYNQRGTRLPARVVSSDFAQALRASIPPSITTPEALPEALPEDAELRPSSSTSTIDALIAEYTTHLHDAPKSVRSNCTRAQRLWAGSGLADDAFVTLMREAYRRTQANAHRIRKPSAEGPSRSSNKMPYFFSVLTRLIEEATQGMPSR